MSTTRATAIDWRSHPLDDREATSAWTVESACSMTARPADVLATLRAFARNEGLQLWVTVEPQDRVVGAVNRVASDLHALRVRAR